MTRLREPTWMSLMKLKVRHWGSMNLRPGREDGTVYDMLGPDLLAYGVNWHGALSGRASTFYLGRAGEPRKEVTEGEQQRAAKSNKIMLSLAPHPKM